MNPSIARIRALAKERAAKVQPLIRELANLPADEDKPLVYRERRTRELRADLASANSNYVAQINEARSAGETQLGRLLRSSKLKAEQIAEVPLVIEQYRDQPRSVQAQLVAEIGADLDAGDPSAAMVKYRAAQTLRIPTGSVDARLAQADPAFSAAKGELDVLQGLADAAVAETNRELAYAGLGTPSHAVAAKSFAGHMKLRPDASFMDQLDPDYRGLTVRQHGFPMDPFAEPHDAERDRQRKVVQRIAGTPPATVEEAEQRHAGR